MKEKELQEAVQLKNEIIVKQSKKISLLEEKFTELRAKYLRLKYEAEEATFNRPELF